MKLPTIGWACSVLNLPSLPAFTDEPLGPISIDTRTLHRGDTFWALRGDRDGHEFVSDAFERGAKAAVVETDWKLPPDRQHVSGFLIRVPDTRRALTTLGRTWRNTLRCPVIGITGTNGKTTTKELLLRMLAIGFRTAGTPGNLNNELGVPLTILSIPNDTEVAVIEMGASHAGEIGELCQVCQPTHGIVTSIGLAHLEGFGSLATLARTKGELYDFVSENGIAFVPVDDELCRVEASICRRRVGYGFNTRPDNWANGFHQGESLEFDEQARARFRYRGHTVRMSAAGYPASLAALAALAVGDTFQLDVLECINVLESWQGTGGRALVTRTARLTVLDDSYNANPNSMRSALLTLSRMQSTRRIAILGDMNELGEYSESEHRRLGEELPQFELDLAILFGPESETTAQVAASLGMRTMHFLDYEHLEKAVLSAVKPGDSVLVKASRSSRLERLVNRLLKMDR